MKVKNIKIEIKPIDEFFKEAAIAMEKISKGEKVTPQRKLGFHDINTFRNFFTPKRLELLSVIKRKKPKSIYELAKVVNRDLKSVNTDVKILHDHDLLELNKQKHKNRVRVVPTFDFDKLVVEMDI
ncbi:hypothetical protein HQ529_01025 [Candidatus Woesearchaeota archaeon]|nr:hypothetical protein [Candidatus Woesearchaeota archaeon]